METAQNTLNQPQAADPAVIPKKSALNYLLIISLIINVLLISVCIGYFFFYSLIVPFIGRVMPSLANILLTKIDVPVLPNGQTIQGIGVLYRFNTQVITVTTDSENRQVIQVKDNLKIPPPIITPNVNFYFNDQNSVTETTVDSLKPGQKITFLSIYRPVQRIWVLQSVYINP